MKLEIKTLENQNAGYMEINDIIAEAKFNKALIWEAINNYLAGKRRGTACTKTRGEVSGGGKKPWKQKHTGRARSGSTRSPLWRHGGTTFGPKPRDYSYPFPRKKRIRALRSILSYKLKEGNVCIIDKLIFEQAKTKEAVKFYKSFNLISGIQKVLFVDFRENSNFYLAVRNIPRAKFIPISYLNVYDLVNCKKIFFSKAAFEKIQEMLVK
ncbi:MAG: 50S ribosomal protein L4 [Candidatus Fischerbacteria bacterium RBG_13_37_8]|uniref:Large ribosomal subunit protein uL4 n=1 Tax=Candidatus Fischerbacteria bacterium RBG_13_37_8 TaxID=1817863 RepID=A0A1F5VE07_9BACT|nr:ribosomal protein L4 [uncultured bacterium]OGF61677.1 MAG: 50S ribosomal protein L4 [Candidatus Fischerbacteria bacterium RBG_13_37_8]